MADPVHIFSQPLVICLPRIIGTEGQRHSIVCRVEVPRGVIFEQEVSEVGSENNWM